MNGHGSIHRSWRVKTVNSNQLHSSSKEMNHQTQPRDSDPSHNRRQRGFPASAVSIDHPATSKNGRREREKEKERTKLRERHRRAITGRILAGLRQYGNFPLPARADMNDVLAALAREAGWIVEADGTTYRSSVSMPALVHATPQPQLIPFKATLDSEPSLLRIEESLSPASIDSVLAADHWDFNTEKYGSISPNNSSDHTMLGAAIADGNFGGTTYVPVYVSLQTGIINDYCQMVDPEALRQELGHLKALNIDGVVVDCWWGIVEGWIPQKYIWTGYRDVFTIIRDYKLKLQVVMAFHEHGGTESSSMSITLPKWVLEIGKDNQDIFFTDREGRRNTEYLSWGIDKERVLNGRTCIEVYFDFMRSFRMEFSDLFEEGLISAVEVGLGVNGELKYPSFPERTGWRYPGIGEFQCYDKYMQRNLRKAAELRGHLFWAKGPDNAGYYNSRPHETGFFCDHGDYDGHHGRFFVQWYVQTLIDHADLVLSLSKFAFEGMQLIVKIPSVYWWYKSRSHAAEITAGYYNPANRDGYSPIFNMLKKHSVTMKFTCLNMLTSSLENDDALADPEGLNRQILNCAWEHELSVAGQSVVPLHDREAYNRLLEIAKPTNDPDHHHFSFFTCQPLTYLSMQEDIFLLELHDLIRSMHGEISNNVGLES